MGIPKALVEYCAQLGLQRRRWILGNGFPG